MVVGVCKLRLYLAGNRSLKGKRHVLRKVKDRLTNKHNVAIAEVDEHDIWQTAVLGISLVGKDKAFVDSELRKVISTIENMHLADIVDEDIELISF